ncbi:hypothetical protein Fcan01_25666 [Folsomia candida]|uniref:Uncharacterized protein n=1 Tax=Folsomia candida TaxID=158441 RepID=A0A226D3L8_FOLCA|nr:hypothetical protein Fcan01_25666 [Folsomia candida]
MPSSIPILLFVGALFGATLAIIQSSSNNPLPQPSPTLPLIYYQKFILANSLQLGESCSWSDETLRQTSSLKMQKFPKGSSQRNDILNSLVSNTVQKGRTYCRALEMQVCDKDTARCVCGEHGVQANLGNRYEPTDYVTELDAGSGKKVCRFSRGASCIPKPAKAEGDTFDFKCAQGLSCNYVKDGTTCTDLSSFKYALDSIRRNETDEEYYEGTLTGKMCKCENEIAGRRSNGRFKRSLNAIFGDQYKPTDYVTELDAGTGKIVCRYNRGAPCKPAPAKDVDEDSFIYQCARGLRCRYVKDGTTCTTLSILEYSMDSDRRNVTDEEYVKGVLSGKRCTCEDEVAGDDKKTNLGGRFKRSLTEHGETYA